MIIILDRTFSVPLEFELSRNESNLGIFSSNILKESSESCSMIAKFSYCLKTHSKKNGIEDYELSIVNE
jgi:hypothetical protein